MFVRLHTSYLVSSIFTLHAQALKQASQAFECLLSFDLGGNRLHSPTHFFTPALRRTSMVMAPRFIPLRLDAIEDIKDYQPGGYRPISVGDTFDHGHFRVLHKLRFGGSSTV
jgi:hypothetical protein